MVTLILSILEKFRSLLSAAVLSCLGSLVSNQSANTRSYLERALINSYHIVLGHPRVRAQLADWSQMPVINTGDPASVNLAAKPQPVNSISRVPMSFSTVLTANFNQQLHYKFSKSQNKYLGKCSAVHVQAGASESWQNFHFSWAKPPVVINYIMLAAASPTPSLAWSQAD